MKETPEEITRRKYFEPGEITLDGFLGPDRRHIHDIIADDASTLAQYGITCAQIADKLQLLLDAGKFGLDADVILEPYHIRTAWSKGGLPCPFADSGLHNKVQVIVANKKTNESMIFSQLSIHMIRKHGFFQGKGSKYRLEPTRLLSFLQFKCIHSIKNGDKMQT